MYKKKSFWVKVIITFVITFLFSIIGNENPDKWSRATFTGLGAAGGFAIGMNFLYGKKDSNKDIQKFD